MNIVKNNKLMKRRRWRIRRKIRGDNEKPRLSVKFTHKHIYVQFIDDKRGVTLASASTRHKATPDRGDMRPNIAGAEKIGAIAAKAAKEKGIENVVFDRSGARYHGKVKALAEAAKAEGLIF
ncbi:MAG: 50S ribosomal protein L18 [Verrucomicrobia bacterium]|nr:50S ribosomal protein L18 [Verrucomicrobiota bacterium]MCF7707831.1 50S ribosomal protein L18 [Verrucomicrobiota bacterium]